jgi:hypothetical protein
MNTPHNNIHTYTSILHIRRAAFSALRERDRAPFLYPHLYFARRLLMKKFKSLFCPFVIAAPAFAGRSLSGGNDDSDPAPPPGGAGAYSSGITQGRK